MPPTRSLLAILLLLTGSACLGHRPTVPAPRAASVEEETARQRLGMLTGTWNSEARARSAAGAVVATSAVAEAHWDLDGRFVVVETTYTAAEDEANPPTSRALFTWDPTAEIYRTWTFHSSGEVASGSMSYDEETRTWAMAESWYDPATGARGTGRGVMRYATDDSKELTWERVDADDPSDVWRHQGTSVRVP